MAYEIKEGEVAIVLHPIIEDGEWTGSIKSGLIFGTQGSEEGMRAALDEALTMAAAQKFLELFPETWEDFADIRSEILREMFPSEYADVEKEIEEGSKDIHDLITDVVYGIDDVDINNLYVKERA